MTNESEPSEQKPPLKKLTNSDTTPESKITAGKAWIGKFQNVWKMRVCGSG